MHHVKPLIFLNLDDPTGAVQLLLNQMNYLFKKLTALETYAGQTIMHQQTDKTLTPRGCKHHTLADTQLLPQGNRRPTR